MAASAEVSTANGAVMPADAGLLEYNREETITAKQSGKITGLNGLDYYKYAAGAVIVQQENDDLTRAVDTAARSLQSQQMALAEKQKRITELETIISGAAVTSPIDGVVLKMDTAVDAELVGGTAPCVVADMSTLVVKAQIAMNDINSVMPGQPAAMTLYNGTEDITLTGSVESVSMQAEENSGNGSMPTYTAVIVLDPLPEGVTVSMGYYVSYQITTAQAEDCITIPTRALVNTEEGTAVFAKPAEGQEFDETIPIPEGTEDIPEGFVLVPVAAGISDSSNVEILSGIDEGTEVFLSGPQDMYAEMSGEG
ncbi:MAG: efflux RND transporter periplasmic adaptor subunit [Butyricicoccus sp.]